MSIIYLGNDSELKKSPKKKWKSDHLHTQMYSFKMKLQQKLFGENQILATSKFKIQIEAE